jgi:hypothetical protein
MAVGIFFRLYRIASIPPGLNHDTAWEGLYAIRITQGVDYTPVVACCTSFARETMFFYVIAFFQLFLGPTQFAINWPRRSGLPPSAFCALSPPV